MNWHHRNFLDRWWQHSSRREDFLASIAKLDRYISRVAPEFRLPVFVLVSSTEDGLINSASSTRP